MTALEHSARVAAARQVLEDTETTPANFTEACLMRHRLRASLETVLGYVDELVSIVNDAAADDPAARRVAEQVRARISEAARWDRGRRRAELEAAGELCRCGNPDNCSCGGAP